jgi:hypothetical protein
MAPGGSVKVSVKVMAFIFLLGLLYLYRGWYPPEGGSVKVSVKVISFVFSLGLLYFYWDYPKEG